MGLYDENRPHELVVRAIDEVTILAVVAALFVVLLRLYVVSRPA